MRDIQDLRNTPEFQGYVHYHYLRETFKRSLAHTIDPIKDRAVLTKKTDTIMAKAEDARLYKMYVKPNAISTKGKRAAINRTLEKLTYDELVRVYRVVNHPELKTLEVGDD